MRWLAGWSAATGHPWTDLDGVVRIETLVESRRIEYLLVEPSQVALDDITTRIGGDRRDVVTIFTGRPADYLVPQAGLTIDRDDEALMVSSLSTQSPRLPDEFETLWEHQGERITLSVLRGDELVAAGNVAVVGHDAIFDRIETMPRFRRRGLGRSVMQLLGDRAVARGARTGILAASADGQRLYDQLGWQHECAMLMFRGAPDT